MSTEGGAAGDAGVARGEAWPFVTVLLPVRNEGASLRRVLCELLAGDYPADRQEVLVIDGRSTDDTRSIVAELARSDLRVRLVDNPERSAAAGLNVGLAAARGEVIVRLDGHAVPERDYVRASVLALERSGAWVVGGAMVGVGRTAFGRAVAAAQQTPFGSGGAAYRSGRRGPADTVYLGAWPRWVFERVGTFDASLARNQDAEMCRRIAACGGLVWLDPSIRTRTLTRDGPTGLASQYFAYGQGRAATVARHPRSLGLRQAVPAATAVLAVALVAGAPGWPAARRALAVAAGTYTVATALASVAAARHLELPDRPWVPVTFPIMHAAWGLGFWLGLAGLLGGRGCRSAAGGGK